MHADLTEPVLITREQNGSVNGVRLTGRCYVTGPHFGANVYSSTEDRSAASIYTRLFAERMVREKWRGLDARIEPVE